MSWTPTSYVEPEAGAVAMAENVRVVAVFEATVACSPAPVPPVMSSSSPAYWLAVQLWEVSTRVVVVPLVAVEDTRALAIGYPSAPLRKVGLLTGFSVAEPGAPHGPLSRLGTALLTNVVEPSGWAPPRSWA